MARCFILAEKPSVAKSFASALKVEWKNNHYENEKYIITNCIGHLYRAYYPEDYNVKYKEWNKDSLPIIPDTFKYKVNEYVKDQAQLVKQLLNKESYEKIVIATDAGREGELIASIVLKESSIFDTSNVYRFWCSSALTDETIQNEMQKLKPIREYANIEKQGYYRSFADWLVGINITRLVSLGSKVICHCGRVKTAVLYEIYRREQEIKNFVPKNYFENIAILSGENKSIKAKMYTVEGEKINTHFDTAIFNKEKFLNKTFLVEKKDTIEKKDLPDKLLNITALQKQAFKELGLSPDETLSIAQKLYEQYKCLSYPRTPSRVMGSTDVSLIKDIFTKLRPIREQYCKQIDISLIDETNKRLFNDELLEDHHALIPLCEISCKASEIEKKVFELVVKNFFANISKPYRYEVTTIYFNCDGEKFLSRGKKELELGFKLIGNYSEQVEGGESEENDFSQINFENLRCIDIVSTAKKTKPKAQYRFDSILAFMENPKDEASDKKLVGLGTPATRAKILQDLIDNKYIKEFKKNLEVLEHGEFLIKQIFSNTCLLPLIDVQTTTNWEEKLVSNSDEFYEQIKAFVKQACSSCNLKPKEKKSLGSCPVCNAEIYEGKNNYYCSGYKNNCAFSISKQIAAATITVNDLSNLLNGKETDKKTCKSKQGKSFTCKFKLNGEGKIEFIFDNKKKRRT